VAPSFQAVTGLRLLVGAVRAGPTPMRELIKVPNSNTFAMHPLVGPKWHENIAAEPLVSQLRAEDPSDLLTSSAWPFTGFIDNAGLAY